MAAPIGTVTFDRPAYAPGDPMVATLNFSDPDSVTSSAAFDLSDLLGHTTVVVGSFTVQDTVTTKANAGNDRVWTLVPGSVTASSAKYTATA